MNSVNIVLVLLVYLTHVALANRYFLPLLSLRQRTRGQGFYDENQYDDGYAEYTGKEKRTFSAMQRRRLQIQNMVEDEPLEKRESVEDVLFRELTRGEYNNRDNYDEEYRNEVEPMNERRFSDFDSERREENFDRLPKRTSQSDEFEDQTVDGVGTAIDDLALKREEEKLKKEEQRKKFDNLPGDGDLFEEDIIMDRRLRSWVTGQFDKRDAINEVSYLWPASERDGKRIVRVPYTLSKEIKQDNVKSTSIRNAIASFNKFTCIRYEPLEKDEGKDVSCVHFKINKTMCYSSVGRQGGKQDISIGNGCERVGTVIHEMMHTIGFIHEQSRPDRDKYIKIFYDHIKKGLEHNFEKYTVGEVETLPVNKDFYDYDSVLQYNNHAFSKDDHDTIESREDPGRRFGQRESFSKHDVIQINELYGCHVDNLHQLVQDISYD